MSDSKHTPGPWCVGASMTGHVFITCQDPFNYICEVETFLHDIERDVMLTDRNEKVTKANANLIAAAPDLLAALKMMQRAFKELIPGIGKIACKDYAIVNDAPIAADVAIAKAEMES